MPVEQNLFTMLANMDVTHHVLHAIRSAQFGLRRRRRHHKVTEERRGVAAIQFVAAERSGFDTLDLLGHYGIPAWTGAVLGIYKENGRTIGNALEMHVTASQETWARYLLKRHGVIVLDEGAKVGPVDALRPPPRAWADGPRETAAAPDKQAINRTRAAAKGGKISTARKIGRELW
jgi:hypothetical protein